jgi:hypothetical protein
MLYDVEFNGHIIVEAEDIDSALQKASDTLDKSGAYIYIENAEVY